MIKIETTTNDMSLGMATLITVLGMLLSAIIAWIVSYKVTKKTIQSQNEQYLQQSVSQMIQIAIQYPYLEDDVFCSKWSKNCPPKTKGYQRYDNYCCFVFNLIESIWEHFNKDKNAIDNFLYIKELIVRHRQWWENPSGTFENLDGYEVEFRNFINGYLK